MLMFHFFPDLLRKAMALAARKRTDDDPSLLQLNSEAFDQAQRRRRELEVEARLEEMSWGTIKFPMV